MSKYNIVIVDDQPSVCKEVAAFLKDSYTVHAFKSGVEMIEYLSSSSNRADLILLDYEMPDMTGYEVLINIRANKNIRETPVVFLTSETNERMKQEMLMRGASDYLCKPVKSAELHTCIQKYLK